MNISQLKYFTTVAQLENVSRAAELLHLSQSSLSKNIAKLEEELQIPLFDRSTKRIRLNAAGARFQECSDLILRELDAAVDDMRLLSTGSDFKIKIGMPGASSGMADCIAAFSRENPGTEFDVNCSIESEEHLDINDFDALIYPESSKYAKFRGCRLCEEQYFLCVSEGSPLAAGAAVNPRALNGQHFVFLRSGKSYVEYPLRLCTALAVSFGSQCYVDSRALHMRMIASGMAAGFVPEGEAHLYQEVPELRLLPVLDSRFSRRLMICFRRDKHLSELARSFRDFCVDYFHLETQIRDAGPGAP